MPTYPSSGTLLHKYHLILSPFSLVLRETDQTLQPKRLNIKQLSMKLSSRLRFAFLCHGLIPLFYQKLHLNSHKPTAAGVWISSSLQPQPSRRTCVHISTAITLHLFSNISHKYHLPLAHNPQFLTPSEATFSVLILQLDYLIVDCALRCELSQAWGYMFGCLPGEHPREGSQAPRKESLWPAQDPVSITASFVSQVAFAIIWVLPLSTFEENCIFSPFPLLSWIIESK